MTAKEQLKEACKIHDHVKKVLESKGLQDWERKEYEQVRTEQVREILRLQKHIETYPEVFKKMKDRYRIQNSDRTIFQAGTGLDSWFTLDKARKLVDYQAGQRIIESDGVNILWEVF